MRVAWRAEARQWISNQGGRQAAAAGAGRTFAVGCSGRSVRLGGSSPRAPRDPAFAFLHGTGDGHRRRRGGWWSAMASSLVLVEAALAEGLAGRPAVLGGRDAVPAGLELRWLERHRTASKAGKRTRGELPTAAATRRRRGASRECVAADWTGSTVGNCRASRRTWAGRLAHRCQGPESRSLPGGRTCSRLSSRRDLQITGWTGPYSSAIARPSAHSGPRPRWRREAEAESEKLGEVGETRTQLGSKRVYTLAPRRVGRGTAHRAAPRECVLAPASLSAPAQSSPRSPRSRSRSLAPLGRPSVASRNARPSRRGGGTDAFWDSQTTPIAPVRRTGWQRPRPPRPCRRSRRSSARPQSPSRRGPQ